MKELQAVLEGVRSSTSSVSCDALSALRHLADKGDASAIDAALERMDDGDDFVREGVLSTVRVLAAPGNEKALEAAIKGLRDSYQGCRVQALACIRELEPDFERVRKEIQEMVRSDCSALVRRAALAAIGHMAAKDDEEAVDTVILVVKKDSDPVVRSQALNSLRLVASRGNAAAVHAAAKRLCDDDSIVKRVAITVLQELAEKGNEKVMAGVMGWVQAADVEEQAQGVDALTLLAARGDPQVVNSIIALLSSTDKRVAAKAGAALGKLATPGDARAIDALVQTLTSEHSRVREAAVAALSLIAPPGDHRLIEAVGKLLIDKSEGVRVEASSTFQTLAAGEENFALEVLIRSLSESESTCGRQTVVSTMASVATPGDGKTIEALSAALTSVSNEDLWWSIVQAVITVGGPGNTIVVDAVSSRLHQGSNEMRRLAVSALKELCEKGCGASGNALMLAAKDGLLDAEPFVRFEALEALVDLTKLPCGIREDWVPFVVVCLNDSSEEVRNACGHTLAALATHGHRTMVEQQVVQLLTSTTSPFTQCACIQTISSLAAKGLPLSLVIEPVCQATQSCHVEVREAAVHCLGSLPVLLNPYVLECLYKCLQDESPAVRIEALVALGSVGDDHEVIGRTVVLLEDEDKAVRTASIEQLATMSTRSGQCAAAIISNIMPRLEHEQYQVRQAAVEVLRKVLTLPHGSPRVPSELADIPMLSSSSSIMLSSPPQSHAVSSSSSSVEATTGKTLQILASIMRDPAPSVRAEAAGVLPLLAGSDNDTLIQMLLKLLEDENPQVRGSAVGALGALARAGRIEGLEGVKKCLADNDMQVRRCAWVWLLEIHGRHDNMEKLVLEWDRSPMPADNPEDANTSYPIFKSSSQTPRSPAHYP